MPTVSPKRHKQRQAAADEGHAVSLPLLHKPRRGIWAQYVYAVVSNTLCDQGLFVATSLLP